MHRLIWILWPSFLVAIVAEGVFFSLFSPKDLLVFGAPLEMSSLGIYTVGFFMFWAFTAASSFLTCLIQKSNAAVNQRH